MPRPRVQNPARMLTILQTARNGVARPAFMALALGAVAACGFQPLAIWPLTILAVAGLIACTARARGTGHAFLIGWAFGLAHFSVGNNWIATAFTYQANMPVWLGGVAVVLLSIYLALYPALATAGAWLLVRRLGGSACSWPFGIALAALWIVTEWLRAWIFTGFAWNPLGVALLGPYDAQGLALLLPWTGTYALSGVLVVIAELLRQAVLSLTGGDRRRRLALLMAVSASVAGLGALMILPARYLEPSEGAIRYTLVQPDIRQEFINDARFYERNFWKVTRLSRPEKEGERRVVLWPESGIPDYLREGYPPHLYRQFTFAGDPAVARERIGRVVGPYALVMSGVVDLVMKNGDDIAARNTVTAIDWRGNIVASYSKAHLVPYGEYLALRWLLEPLGATRLVPGALDFWAGPGPLTYDLGEYGRVAVQICYEIIFSGQVVDPEHRPDYIFNPSNDGWFGSWGPPQHLAQARLRAIEEGLPVLRATTTGISAVIDANGIVRHHIPRHREGRIDGRIPPPHAPTLFARIGNALPLAWAVLLLMGSTVALRRRKR